MKVSRLAVVGFLLTLVSVSHPAMAIGIGDPAPDFELESTKGGKVKLSNLKGKNVLINFYNFDFSAT